MAQKYAKFSRKMVVIKDDAKSLPLDAEPKEFGRGLIPRDWEQDPFCSSPYATSLEAAGIEIPPRSDWPDIIAERKAKKATMRERKKRAGKKIKNQGQTPLCWSFGTTSAYEATAFVMQGQPIVDMSPASCASYVTGWRQRGGWNAEAAEHIAERGLVPTSKWGGSQTSFARQLDTPENRELAKRFTSIRHIDVRPSFDELAALIFAGFSVATAHNWWRHLVCTDDIDQIGRDTFVSVIENSWGTNWSDGGYGVLQEGKATPASATCFHVVRPVVYQE